MTPTEVGWLLVAGALLVVLVVRIDYRDWQRRNTRRCLNDAHRAHVALFQGGKAYWE